MYALPANVNRYSSDGLLIQSPGGLSSAHHWTGGFYTRGDSENFQRAMTMSYPQVSFANPQAPTVTTADGQADVFAPPPSVVSGANAPPPVSASFVPTLPSLLASSSALNNIENFELIDGGQAATVDISFTGNFLSISTMTLIRYMIVLVLCVSLAYLVSKGTYRYIESRRQNEKMTPGGFGIMAAIVLAIIILMTVPFSYF